MWLNNGTYSLVLDDHLGLGPKVSIRKVMDAAIQMAILGGKEVVRVRYLSFVISHFFLIFLNHHFTSVLLFQGIYIKE